MIETHHIWDWNPLIAAAAGLPRDFAPVAAELAMLDHALPPLAPAEVEELLASEDGERGLAMFLVERHEKVWKARQDPLRHGWELPFWGEIRHQLTMKDEAYMFSANDVGKSEFGAKIACEVLTKRFTWQNQMAGAPQVLCIAQSDPASKLQQAKIYKYLPTYARQWNEREGSKKRNAFQKINWSQSDGFTGQNFVLPRPKGAQCSFRTVASWLKGELSFEGFAFHFVWIDEDCPVGMWDALRVRAGKVGGKMLFTFTPVQGYGGVCKAVLNGARVVKSLPMQWQWSSRTADRAARGMTNDECQMTKEAA